MCTPVLRPSHNQRLGSHTVNEMDTKIIAMMIDEVREKRDALQALYSTSGATEPSREDAIELRRLGSLIQMAEAALARMTPRIHAPDVDQQ